MDVERAKGFNERNKIYRQFFPCFISIKTFDQFTFSLHCFVILPFFALFAVKVIGHLFDNVALTLFLSPPHNYQFNGRRLAVKRRSKQKAFSFIFLLYCRVFWTFLFGCYSDKLALTNRRGFFHNYKAQCSSCVNIDSRISCWEFSVSFYWIVVGSARVVEKPFRFH